MNRETTCCFTGHRPEKLPWREDEGNPRCLELKARLAGAVEAARRAAGPGDVVVLSPACAAFDRFKNFMERGRVFKDLVNALK